MEKNRPVIVKFVRRQVKNDIMQNVSKLKSTWLYISHDPTWLSQQLLSSLRQTQNERKNVGATMVYSMVHLNRN
jgi:hypothetical protein